MASRIVPLELTPEQEETLKALFGHYGWEYKEAPLKIKAKAGLCTSIIGLLH